MMWSNQPSLETLKNQLTCTSSLALVLYVCHMQSYDPEDHYSSHY